MRERARQTERHRGREEELKAKLTTLLKYFCDEDDDDDLLL